MFLSSSLSLLLNQTVLQPTSILSVRTSSKLLNRIVAVEPAGNSCRQLGGPALSLELSFDITARE